MDNYNIDFFLANDDFVSWARSRKSVEGTPWQALIASDPNIRSDFEQARILVLEWEALPSQLSDVKMDQHISRIMTSVSARESAGLPAKNLFGIWYKVAAILIVTLGVSWLAMRQNQKSKDFTYENLTRHVESPLTEISNVSGKDYEVSLPDGSKVILSKDSRISFSKSILRDSTRNVYLKGDGYFDVAKDKKHPFLVYTGGLVTRVVGTSFKISSLGSKVSVLVKSGKVAVYRMSAAEVSVKNDFLLTPNQEAVYLEDQNLISKKLADHPVVVEDQQALQSFDYVETPVSAIFSTLEKAYQIKISYDPEIFKNCKLTIPLKEEPFFTKLDIICRTIQAKYKISGDVVIISGGGCN